jgi:ketosteroid isomerase-like protein
MRYMPDRVRATPDGAFEAGHWTETWMERGDRTALTGPYYALWRREPSGWRIVAEVFLPTGCAGITYCAH